MVALSFQLIFVAFAFQALMLQLSSELYQYSGMGGSRDPDANLFAKRNGMADAWFRWKEYHRLMQPVPDDGDCLFSAAAVHGPNDPHLLRAAAMGFARTNPFWVPDSGMFLGFFAVILCHVVFYCNLTAIIYYSMRYYCYMSAIILQFPMYY